MLKRMAATKLEVLLNPLTMIESGGADIVMSRVCRITRHAITACGVELYGGKRRGQIR